MLDWISDIESLTLYTRKAPCALHTLKKSWQSILSRSPILWPGLLPFHSIVLLVVFLFFSGGECKHSAEHFFMRLFNN
jgi:hypothetical protein